MKKLKPILFMAFTILTICSCSKDNDSDTTPTPEPTPTDITLTLTATVVGDITSESIVEYHDASNTLVTEPLVLTDGKWAKTIIITEDYVPLFKATGNNSTGGSVVIDSFSTNGSADGQDSMGHNLPFSFSLDAF